MDSKKLKIRLSERQVAQLIASFDETKKGVSAVQEIIDNKTATILKEGTVIDDDFMQDLTAIAAPISNQLKQYTDGFRTFSRSMARKKREPDEALQILLEQVRSVRPQAEQLLTDFEWTLQNACDRISIHNSILNAQPVSGGISQIETPAADRSETEGGGQGGEGLPEHIT